MNYKIERWTQNVAPDAAKLKARMESENFRVFQWRDTPNAFYPLHVHGAEQSHWIISGSLELTIASVGVFVLNAGDRDFMPAQTSHSARVLKDVPVVYLIGEKVN